MKRIFALLLALVLCLGLAACQSQTKDEKAYEAANALLEAGDYEGALQAFASIELYVNIQEKIYQIQTQMAAEKAAAYVGTWKDLNTSTVVIIRDDGTYQTINEFGEAWDGELFFEGESLWLLGLMRPTEQNGILHLVSESSDLVREADYEVLGAKEVEITLENWETYFEIREAKHIARNEFGDVSYAFFGSGIFLKEEYARKLYNQYDACNVTFKATYDEQHHHIEGDYPGGEFSLGEAFVDPWWDYQTREAVVSPWYQEHEDMEESDFYQKFGAEFPGFISESEGNVEAVIPINITITDVTGTLKLFP